MSPLDTPKCFWGKQWQIRFNKKRWLVFQIVTHFSSCDLFLQGWFFFHMWIIFRVWPIISIVPLFFKLWPSLRSVIHFSTFECECEYNVYPRIFYVWSLFQVWPIFPSVTHFFNCDQFFNCDLSLSLWPIFFWSVTHFSRCELFSEMWPIFLRLTYFSKCDTFFQVWQIFYSVTHVTLLLFCPRGPLGHLIFSRASGYYAKKTSSFKFGGNG